MIAEADRFERDFRTGTAGTTERLWRRLSDLMVLDVAPVVGEAVLELDGRPEQYRTFVYEVVVVPLGAACDARTMTQWWPTLDVVLSPSGPSMTGAGGRARIEQVSDSSGPCQMFSPGNPSVRNQPHPAYGYTRADCARVQFEVSADVELARREGDSRVALAPDLLWHAPKRFTIAPQVVPGVRFTVYCTPKIPDLMSACIREEWAERLGPFGRQPAPPPPAPQAPAPDSATPPGPAPPPPDAAPPAPRSLRPPDRRPAKRPARAPDPRPNAEPAADSPPNHGAR